MSISPHVDPLLQQQLADWQALARFAERQWLATSDALRQLLRELTEGTPTAELDLKPAYTALLGKIPEEPHASRDA